MAIEKKFVQEAVHRLLLKEYLRKETQRAGFGGIDIQRTPMGMRVSIIAERPGMVIGRKGSTINALTDDLRRRFHVENPQIEVVEAGNDANINAQIMAQKLAEALERGWHFRRAGHSTVQRVIGYGAQGCQVIVSGKLTGQRHRTEKFSQGHIKYCGETADRVMDVGFAVAKKKLGVIGCTVRIMRAEWKLPDNITIIPPTARAAPADEADQEEAAPEAKEEKPKRRPAAKKPAKKPAAKKAEEPKPAPKKEEAKPAPTPAPKKEEAKPAAEEKPAATPVPQKKEEDEAKPAVGEKPAPKPSPKEEAKPAADEADAAPVPQKKEADKQAEPAKAPQPPTKDEKPETASAEPKEAAEPPAEPSKPKAAPKQEEASDEAKDEKKDAGEKKDGDA